MTDLANDEADDVVAALAGRQGEDAELMRRAADTIFQLRMKLEETQAALATARRAMETSPILASTLERMRGEF